MSEDNPCLECGCLFSLQGRSEYWLIHLLPQPGEKGSWALKPGPREGGLGGLVRLGLAASGASPGVAQLLLSWRLGL